MSPPPDPPADRSRIAAFPLGTGLYDAFVAAVARHDPTLPEDALAEIPQAGAALLPERALQAALRWIWIEDLPYFDTPQEQDRLRGVPGSFSSISRARLKLEERVRKVIAAMASEVDRGDLKLTGIDPQTLTRVPVLPELLLELKLGHDRMHEQIPTAKGYLKYLRFDDGHDPAQGRLFDKANPLQSTDPSPGKTDTEAPETPPAPEDITEARWRVLWLLYDARVRQLGRRPSIEEDDDWRRLPGIKLFQREIRAVRKAWADMNPC